MRGGKCRSLNSIIYGIIILVRFIFEVTLLSSLKKVFITESARNKDKYHSSHTHSTDCCLQRWLPISPRGPSGHRGDSKDWSRLWRTHKEWSGAPRPGPPHGGPSLPSGKLLLIIISVPRDECVPLIFTLFQELLSSYFIQ